MRERGILELMGQTLLPNSEFTDYTDDGVDMTLVRHFLSLTPAERLEMAEDLSEFVAEIRRLNGLPEIPEHTENPA
jgi:hypothetical protein